MKLKKKALLYDIANLAYVVADHIDAPASPTSCHALHLVRDICQEGNLHRVARVLGIAYSKILVALAPVIQPQHFNLHNDLSALPHDYTIEWRRDENLRFRLTNEIKLKIKEAAHEYMVCMVLADWLAITLPEAADVWKERALKALQVLEETAASVIAGASSVFRRKISPF